MVQIDCIGEGSEIVRFVIGLLVVLASASAAELRAVRIGNAPILTPESDPSIGSNLNGPSMIRVPRWVRKPLGRYYLYFASHTGTYIRMAYADRVEGPWKVYQPGVLRLEDVKPCSGHIASPDVLVDHERRQIRMYFHGPAHKDGRKLGQMSLVSLSGDGLHFTARDEILGPSYFRVFRWGGYYYAIARGGEAFRSPDGLPPFEEGPKLFSGDPGYVVRHVAVMLDGNNLTVVYSRIGDSPESILSSHIHLTRDWNSWTPSPPKLVLASERDYEGANLPVQVSRSGPARSPVHQLRDPAIYREGAKTYLLYSVAGESGIALARLHRERSGKN